MAVKLKKNKSKSDKSRSTWNSRKYVMTVTDFSCTMDVLKSFMRFFHHTYEPYGPLEHINLCDWIGRSWFLGKIWPYGKKYSNIFFRSPTTFLKIKRRLIQAWIWPLLISNGVEIMVCLDIIFTGTYLKVNYFQNVPFLLTSGIRGFRKDNRNNYLLFGFEKVKRVTNSKTVFWIFFLSRIFQAIRLFLTEKKL